MNKKTVSFDLKNFKLWLAVLSIFMIPLVVNAGDFYQCRDKYGNESLVDFPIEGQTCTQVGTHQETSSNRRENKSVVSAE